MSKRQFVKLFLIISVAPLVAIAFLGRDLWKSLLKISYLDTIPQSNHFDGKRFFNSFFPTQRKSFKEILDWRLNSQQGYWPDKVEITPDYPPERVIGKKIRSTFVGHATVLLQTAGINILFDPVWDDRASPISFIGPKRIAKPGIRLEDLPMIDYIAISHNHYDHLSIRSLKSILERQLEKFNQQPTIITPLGNGKIIRAAGLAFDIKEGDWYDSFPLLKSDYALKLTIEPTQHWSLRGAFDYNRCLWGAFVISSSKSDYGNIYFAGDSGWGRGEHFLATKKRYGTFRFAMIPIGAYEPRNFMKSQHINPQEAVQVAEILKPKTAMAIHFQTFKGLTNESYDDPVISLAEALQQSDFQEKRFKTLKAGEHLNV